MTLRTLNYGNYGIFLIMGNAGFCPSTVAHDGVTASMKGAGSCLTGPWHHEILEDQREVQHQAGQHSLQDSALRNSGADCIQS